MKDIIDSTDYLADSFWNLMHSKYAEKRLNETAFQHKVRIGFRLLPLFFVVNYRLRKTYMLL